MKVGLVGRGEEEGEEGKGLREGEGRLKKRKGSRRERDLIRN